VVGCGFVCTDFAGTDRRFDHDATNPARQHCDVMDWDEIQRLQREGWSIGGHTANHVRLSACDPPTLARELRDCLTALRERLGLRDVALAYPFGGPQDITPAAVEQARACGYAAVLSDFDGENVPGGDLFALGRFELGGDHDPIAWRAKIHALDIEQIFLVPRPSGAPVTRT
jgi:peptidoglycan/xylan/chitin deacetylase (PgdA/CDA1 family)